MIKVEIYTSAMCAYCLAAKNLLKQQGFDYVEVRVDREPARLQELLARTSRRSLPQIFIGERHLGGYEELQAAAHSGELSTIIRGNP